MIERMEWKKEYELGVQVIDGQHKKLVELAGDLYNALTGDPEQYKLNLAKILKALGNYTIYHFSTEERFMKKYEYPGTEIHKLAHRNFIAELNNQVQKLAKNSIDDGVRFYEYIGSWLLTHIAKSDKLLADYIIKKAGAAAEIPEAGEKDKTPLAASVF